VRGAWEDEDDRCERHGQGLPLSGKRADCEEVRRASVSSSSRRAHGRTSQRLHRGYPWPALGGRTALSPCSRRSSSTVAAERTCPQEASTGRPSWETSYTLVLLIGVSLDGSVCVTLRKKRRNRRCMVYQHRFQQHMHRILPWLRPDNPLRQPSF